MILKWVGGKKKLAKQIISIMPPHKQYIEPFFGGGWVFFTKPLAENNIINDVNADLMNMYEVLRDEPHEMMRLVRYTPKTEAEFAKFVHMYWNNRPAYDKRNRAFRAMVYMFIVKSSFNGIGKSFSLTPSWQSEEFFERLVALSEKLADTIILTRDYKQVLYDYANKDSLVYLDPPYTVTIDDDVAYYEYQMSMKEHTELRDIIVARKDKFKWILSYDTSSIIADLYKDIPGVYIHKTEHIFQSSINKLAGISQDRTESMKQEYLITNFNIMDTSPLFLQEINDGDIQH
jgi:DNA adenine methylase